MLNIVSLMGRLTKDPELRSTSNNIPYVNFTLAVERNYTDQKDEKQTDFIDCVAWRSTAEFICKYFSKGRLMALSGSLQVRSWSDKDNNKRRSTEVIADGVYFCDAKRPDANGVQANGGHQNGNPPGPNQYGGVQNGNGYGNAYGAPAGPGSYPGNSYGGGNGYPSNNYAGQNSYGVPQNNNGYGNNPGGQNYGGNGGYTNYADTNGFNGASMPAPATSPQHNNPLPPVADMSQPYQNGFGGANDPKCNV